MCVTYLPSGIPIKTTLDNSSTVQYAGLIHQLVMKARSTVRDMDPQNDLTFLRVRSKKNEIMIAPGEREKKRRPQTEFLQDNQQQERLLLFLLHFSTMYRVNIN